MVCLNDEMKRQNELILAKLPNISKYSKKTLDDALEELNQGDFYTEGLYRLLLRNLDLEGKYDSTNKTVEDIKNNPRLNDPTNTPEYNKLKDEISKNSETIKDTNIKNIQERDRLIQEIRTLEMKGQISQPLISIKNQIDELGEKAAQLKLILRRVGEDNKLTGTEKREILKYWEQIKNELDIISAQARSNGVDPEAYTGKFNELLEFVRGMKLQEDSMTPVDGSTLEAVFNAYLTSRDSLLKAILSKLKQESDKIINKTVESMRESTNGTVEIFKIKDEAKEFETEFKRMMSDNELTSIEKKTFKEKYYDKLKERLPNDYALADKHGISKDPLTKAVERIDAIITETGMFEHMDETTQFGSGVLNGLRSKFMEGYNEELKIYNASLAKNIEEIQNFNSEFETHSTKVDKTDKKITNAAESLELLKDKAIINRTVSEITSKGSRDITSSTIVFKEVNDVLDKINSMGENLFVKSTSMSGDIATGTGLILDAYEGTRYSDYISFPSNMKGTLTVFKNQGYNKLKIAWYNENKEFISAEELGGTEEQFHLTALSPEKTMYARVSAQNVNNVDLQFEMGEVVTPFKLSVTDIMNNVVLARKQLDGRKEDRDLFSAKYNEYIKNNIVNGIIDIISDGRITAKEKDELKNKLALLEKYNTELGRPIGEAGLKKPDFDENYNKVKEALDVITSTDNEETIQPTNLMNNVRRYGSQLDGAVKSMTEFFDGLIKDASAKVEKSIESELAAESLKNQLKEKVENLSRMLSNIRNYKSSEKSKADKTLDSIQTMSESGIVKGIDKAYLSDYMSRINGEEKWYETQADRLSIGKSEYLRRKEALDKLVNPMLTNDLLDDDSTVNNEEFVKRFTEYYDARNRLLGDIIKASESELSNLQDSLSKAIYLVNTKSEKSIEERNRIIEGNKEINRINERLKELRENVPYRINLVSSRGDKFRDGNVDTTLTCRVFKGDVEITDQIKPHNFRWSKRNSDGTEDIAWGRSKEGSGNVINITHEDVANKAVFSVEVFQEVES